MTPILLFASAAAAAAYAVWAWLGEYWREWFDLN